MRVMMARMVPLLDLFLMPFVYPCALLLKIVRRAGVERLPNCKRALMRVGVFPIRNHYYEPRFDFRSSDLEFSKERNLPGIDLNVPAQLEFMKQFSFASELEGVPKVKTGKLEFHFDNGAFESGDAEYWYQIIRATKPSRIVEIGSGYSTLMAISAIEMNETDDQNYRCEHVCVEPYEREWLEETGVKVIRERVEELDLGFFSQLQEGDILFIDSSHMIRPDGDVLFEYLEVLPSLQKGVVVHIHDIFTPRGYLETWVKDKVKFWNEQYLLEAFLTHNTTWKVVGALNYLHHNYHHELKSIAPHLSPEREPGSFYLRKVL